MHKIDRKGGGAQKSFTRTDPNLLNAMAQKVFKVQSEYKRGKGKGKDAVPSKNRNIWISFLLFDSKEHFKTALIPLFLHLVSSTTFKERVEDRGINTYTKNLLISEKSVVGI